MIGKVVVFLAVVAVVSCSPVPDEFQDRSGRIVGGQNAPLGRFPWAASLRFSNGDHFCGASIINNRWLLSAAHCTINRAPSSVRAIVGSVMLSGANGVNHALSRIVNHPNWGIQGIAGHDVSVLQTTNTIVFNTNVRSIELGSAFVGGGVGANAIGWGLTSTGGQLANQLQFVNLVTITSAQCGAADVIICTQVPAGRGTCSGDSGGALSSAGSQIGIVAWGRGGCGDGQADGFTRISSFRTWILNNAR